MRRRRGSDRIGLLGPLALAVPFAIGAALAADTSDADEAFAFRDRAIVESSGLVVDGEFLVTTNDSGDGGRVFTVSASGQTVGVTTWADDPVDVEALAPAGPGHVWVGDIGDNSSARDSVSVTRVPVGEGDRSVTEPAIRLVYPDGPHDAEGLLAHPTTGRLYVVSKEVFGGTLYEAPEGLDESADNRLRSLGQVAGLVTDGGFLPDGRHLVLRTYSRAFVYTFPGLEAVGDLELPQQEQGEGLAVIDAGTVYLSSEGARSEVLRLRLPERITRATSDTTAPAPNASGTPGERSTPSGNELAAEPRDRDVWPWLLGGVALVLMTITLLRALRPR